MRWLPTLGPLPALLHALSWPEWRLHPWRHAAVALAVALGVALAFSVQLINDSALAEFAGAVRAANGEPDVSLVGRDNAGIDDDLLDALLLDPAVRVASPVLEADTLARNAAGGEPVSLRAIGIDALQVFALAPALVPRLDAAADAPGGPQRLTMLDPDVAFANATALQRLNLHSGDTIELRGAAGWQRLRIAGTVALGGPPTLVLDVASAQQRFGHAGRLTRIDLRLAAGVHADAWQRRQAWPAGVHAAASADDATQRVSNLSRAYRVNLSVLALVALFVGGFLVYSVLALSVAQRTPTFALLGVLGMPGRERRALVLAEAALVGAAGSVIGLAVGAALAAAVLQRLGGDLGGGYFTGIAPQLRWSWPSALGYGALGTLTAVAGAWWPARRAEALPPAQAQALKGLSSLGPARSRVGPAAALLALAAALALLPPVGGLPLAAYASVAALLAGGVALVPTLVQALLLRPARPRRALLLLARERARHQRHTASATVAGVVASLALSVALTVMVSSFRDAVSAWLDGVLPADLYLRSRGGLAAAELNTLDPAFAHAAAQLPGVARVRASRVKALLLAPQRPPLALIVRPVDDTANALPWLGTVLAPAAGDTGVYASEPAAALYNLSVGGQLDLPLPDGMQRVRVLGIWRDYARQFGAIVVDPTLWRRHGGDARINELALWLQPGADAAQVAVRLRALAGADSPVDTASAGELRALSLAIFDRSFAVTRYLQLVAIAVGLIGVAASLSAQVLARRKEFGLLAHLGLTRRQVLAVVTGEAAVWLAAGAALGLALGVAVSAVLVMVVNPQSFHWTMPLRLPWPQLIALTLAVWACGLITAAWAARRAASHAAVLAVKEDW